MQLLLRPIYIVYNYINTSPTSLVSFPDPTSREEKGSGELGPNLWFSFYGALRMDAQAIGG